MYHKFIKELSEVGLYLPASSRDTKEFDNLQALFSLKYCPSFLLKPKLQLSVLLLKYASKNKRFFNSIGRAIIMAIQKISDAVDDESYIHSVVLEAFVQRQQSGLDSGQYSAELPENCDRYFFQIVAGKMANKIDIIYASLDEGKKEIICLFKTDDQTLHEHKIPIVQLTDIDIIAQLKDSDKFKLFLNIMRGAINNILFVEQISLHRENKKTSYFIRRGCLSATAQFIDCNSTYIQLDSIMTKNDINKKFTGHNSRKTVNIASLLVEKLKEWACPFKCLESMIYYFPQMADIFLSKVSENNNNTISGFNENYLVMCTKDMFETATLSILKRYNFLYSYLETRLPVIRLKNYSEDLIDKLKHIKKHQSYNIPMCFIIQNSHLDENKLEELFEKLSIPIVCHPTNKNIKKTVRFGCFFQIENLINNRYNPHVNKKYLYRHGKYLHEIHKNNQLRRNPMTGWQEQTVSYLADKLNNISSGTDKRKTNVGLFNNEKLPRGARAIQAECNMMLSLYSCTQLDYANLIYIISEACGDPKQAYGDPKQPLLGNLNENHIKQKSSCLGKIFKVGMGRSQESQNLYEEIIEYLIDIHSKYDYNRLSIK